MQINITSGSTAETSKNNLLTAVSDTIRSENLIEPSSAILVAVSGGKDSMTLLDVLRSLDYKVAAAHCDFQLREDSHKDQYPIQKYCADHDLKLYTKKFDTKNYAAENNLSTQEAARALRYEWFEQVRQENSYDYIATAHHAQDLIETFFINLLRGSGIQGLSSIPIKNNSVIRPMLYADYALIEDHVSVHKILYTEDSSNASDLYLRNRIRHHLIPILDDIAPHALRSTLDSILHLKEEKSMIDSFIALAQKENVSEKNGITRIDKKFCTAIQEPSYFYWFLKRWDFSAEVSSEIAESIDHVGNQFYSPTHHLVVGSKEFVIQKINKSENDPVPYDHDLKVWSHPTLPLEIKQMPSLSASDKNNIGLGIKDMDLPMYVRFWKDGDFFYPSGMNGKKQKLKKYFANQKIDRITKKRIPLLVDSSDQIVWIIGHRADERYIGDDLYLSASFTG